MDMVVLGENNDFQGEWSQELVAKWLKQISGKDYEIQDTRGIDIICGDFKVEVKSISSLIQRNVHPISEGKSKYDKRKRKCHYQLRHFKINHNQMFEDITHYAFVIKDDLLIPDPAILIVESHCINKFISRKKTSNWYHIPIWFVLENYSWDISKAGGIRNKTIT